jgi:catechol 2,3-dioxygenase-like lactoylglutathione lyase family enzyme
MSNIADLEGLVARSEPMFRVEDMRKTVDWYTSLGFTVVDHYWDGDELIFARVLFGTGRFMLSPGGCPGPSGVNQWFYVERVEELYARLKARTPALRFTEELYDPFYGGRQFSIEDPSGLSLVFYQPGPPPRPAGT